MSFFFRGSLYIYLHPATWIPALYHVYVSKLSVAQKGSTFTVAVKATEDKHSVTMRSSSIRTYGN
jgi:hypothetical protein